ncbi:G patch domain-containing protein 1 [Chamberlinius hualienensis]
MISDGEEEDEKFISYGTPLIKDITELEEVPRKKPVPVEHQIATDDKGRRRFHGAFTGGFSAGYFNSVGTKEGWAPANFLSTRGSRADKRDQNPEDFMDEEDLGAFGIAPRAIRVQKDFREEKEDNSRKRPYESVFNKATIPGTAPLKDFVVPTSDSIGVKLLKKMGWKPGQGIGPRVTMKDKKLHKSSSKTNKPETGVKIYGCAIPEDFQHPDSSSSGDEAYDGLTFAPDDVTVRYFSNPKDNWYGIGYVGLDKNPVLSKKTEQPAGPVIDKGQRLAIGGEAFGVGAFEKDDDTIYNNDDMSQYDFELNAAAEEKTKSWKRDSSVGYIGKELEGFHISSKPLLGKKFYPSPAIPKDFQPIHRYTKTSETAEEKVEESGKQRMNSLSRGAVIGEPSSLASVFDLLKPEDRERLKNVKHKPNQLERSKSKVERDTKVVSIKSPAVSKPSKSVSEALKPSQPSLPLPAFERQPLASFRPFANDEDKQKRYEFYLYLKKIKNEGEIVKYFPASYSRWEKERELEEFSRASDLYKPMASEMASRFVSSGHINPANNVESEQVQPPDGLSKPVVHPQVSRETVEWHPDPMLCKRFNVPNPFPESQIVGVVNAVKKGKSTANYFAILDSKSENVADIPTPPNNSRAEPSSEPGTSKKSLFDGLDKKPIPTFTIPSAEEVEAEENEMSEDEESETAERPPIDLFRAIFANSDSEEDAQENATETAQVVSVPKPFSLADVSQIAAPSTSEQPVKQDRRSTGLFAHLNLAPPTPVIQPTSHIDKSKINSVAVKSAVEHYGPSLPPHHKEKHHSKKHKHRRKSSDEDDSEESEDELSYKQKKIMEKQISSKLRNLMKSKS